MIHALAHAIHTVALWVGYTCLITMALGVVIVTHLVRHDLRVERRRENMRRVNSRFAEIRNEQD